VFSLAPDITKHGINPLERVVLIPVNATGGRITGYVMAEGNRRLCALKLLGDPDLAPADLRKSFQDLATRWTPITSLPAVVFDSMEAGRIWLERIHSGYQGGIGRRDWNSDQKQRFSGGAKNRTAQLFLDYAETEGMITPEQRKGKLTTVQRFIGNDVFRELLGIDQSDPEQLQRTRPKPDFDILAKRFVRDLLERTNVNSRMNKDQIIEYARPLNSVTGVTGTRIQPEPLSSAGASGPSRRQTQSRRPAHAKHVQYEDEIGAALKSYGNDKLQSLYHSICTVDLDPHTPIVAIGTWAFFESLTACAERPNHIAFGSFLSNSRLGTYGITGDRTAIRSELDRVRD
jgi:hypothetical protein